jgi:5-hydroxyisourate hydrolase
MITTHVLDIALGRPASGVHVLLELMDARDSWNVAGRGVTDDEGRLRTLLTTAPAPGVYRLVFDTRSYFERQGLRAFYPNVSVTFNVDDGNDHYHVPLLLSPFGYSTYRGT